MEMHDSSTSSSSPSPSASSLAVRPRRRAQHQNSKKGCLTCKQRHMKCDETEPICLRCQRSNRECIKDKRQASKPAFRAFKVVSFPAPAAPPARKLRPEGVVYLEYFCRQTLPMLSRCQPSPVWRAVTHLLQDPSSSLRHVASAVGYQHLTSDTGQSTSAKVEFALTAHAVGALRNSIAEAPRDDVVEPLFAACFLTMLESLQGSVSKTMTHLEGGIRLARERVTQQTTTPEISDCLRFMEDHARAIVLLEAPSDAGRRSKLLLSIDQLPQQALHLPDALHADSTDDGTSIISAIHQQEIRMVSLFLAYHRGEANIRTTPSGAQAQFFTQVVRSLRAQQKHLETFVDAKLSHNTVTRDDALAARYSIAKAKCLLQRIILGMETNYVQTDWDRSLDDFVAVLDWIEMALDRLRAAGSSGGASPPLSSSPLAVQPADPPPAAFSLGMGVHDPLMMVAVKCRDPFVRRRAVALFEKCPRREGPWSTLHARRMCTTVIAYEERRALQRMGHSAKPLHTLSMANVSNRDRAFLNHITELQSDESGTSMSKGVKVYVPDENSPLGWITEDLPFEDLAETTRE